MPVGACPLHDLRAVKMPRERHNLCGAGDGVRAGGEHQWVSTQLDLQLPPQHLCKELSDPSANPILQV